MGARMKAKRMIHRAAWKGPHGSVPKGETPLTEDTDQLGVVDGGEGLKTARAPPPLDLGANAGAGHGEAAPSYPDAV